MKRRLILALAVPVTVFLSGVISRDLRRRGNTRAADRMERFVAVLQGSRTRSRRPWHRR